MNQTAPLPSELCRYIVCLAGDDGSESQETYWSNDTFEWPVRSLGDSRQPQPPPPSRSPSIPTIHALSLVSRQFWEIASEFLYDTIYIHCLDDARFLAASSRMLRKWTKHMVIAPFFPEDMDNEIFQTLAQQFGLSMVLILADCGRLESLVIRAYWASQIVTNEHWMKTYKAIPCGCKHLEIYDEGFHRSASTELWEPRHLIELNSDYHLLSLRIQAVHGRNNYTFTNITHLSLLSWPIATNWILPELTSIHIAYLANSPIAQSFWLSPNPKLDLLHLGFITNLAEFKDFPQLVSQKAPNLRRLIYYHYGDVDIPWDPTKLPASLREVTVKISHHSVFGEGGGGWMDTIEKQGGGQLTAAAVQRWSRLAEHLTRYAIRPTVVFPHDALCDYLLGMVNSIFSLKGADVVFSLT